MASNGTIFMWATAAAVILCFAALIGSSASMSASAEAARSGSAIHQEIVEQYERAEPELARRLRSLNHDPAGVHPFDVAVEEYGRSHLPEKHAERNRYYAESGNLRYKSGQFTDAAVAVAGVYLLVLLLLGLRHMVSRAASRGQRAGAVCIIASLAFPAYHLARFGTGDFKDCFLQESTGTGFIVTATLGVMLFLRIPQRVIAWIAGGEKE